MKRCIVIVVAVALFALSGCVVKQTGGRPTEKVDKQKVLENHIDLGMRYISRGNRELARKHLDKALEIDPNSSGAYTCYALVYDQEGEKELAEENFLKAIKYDAGNIRAKFYYGVFLAGQQRFEKARKQFLRVTESVDYPHRALAFVSLGQAELKLGNPKAAREAFEKSLRLNAGSAPLYLELADLEYVAGNYSLAAQYLAQYRQLARQSARSLWLGVRLEHRLKNRDAEASYGLALEKMFPDSKENLAYQQWRKKQ